MIRQFMDNGQFLGSELETGSAFFFFGTNKLSQANLAERFPRFQFCFVKQVHGHHIVHASLDVLAADGHFTGTAGQALVIQTADCVPVLLGNNSQVCALHVGWRGAAGDIVGASRTAFVEPPEVAAIGPHIGFDSFEIGREVLERLLVHVPEGAITSQLVRDHVDVAKCYFNLAGLIRLQLLSRFPEIQIFEINGNTFTNHDYHSFRRDKAGAGRQVSFVVLKS